MHLYGFPKYSSLKEMGRSGKTFTTFIPNKASFFQHVNTKEFVPGEERNGYVISSEMRESGCAFS